MMSEFEFKLEALKSICLFITAMATLATAIFVGASMMDIHAMKRELIDSINAPAMEAAERGEIEN